MQTPTRSEWPEAELGQILRAVTDGVAVVGLDYTVRRISRSYLDLLGLDEKEALGKKCHDVLRGSFCRTRCCPLHRIRKDCAGRAGIACPPLSMEVVKHLPDRRRVPFLLTVRPYYAGKGELAGIIQDLKNIQQLETTQKALRKTILRLQNTIKGTIESMAALIEARDPYTAGHQVNVALLSRAVAKEMGLPRSRVETLWVAAMVHDVGKVAVPFEFLTRPGRLTAKEFAILQEHPAAGGRILAPIDFPGPVAEIVRQHHERLNGSGYPRGLSGASILLEAKVVAVADVLEAMAAHRPYRPSKGIDAAVREIVRHRGVLYDPRVVDACLAIVRTGKLPFGT